MAEPVRIVGVPGVDSLPLGRSASNMQAGEIFKIVGGKIVSVEARHASVIRTLLGNEFAPAAFDDALTPNQVLSMADPFIENPITLRNV